MKSFGLGKEHVLVCFWLDVSYRAGWWESFFRRLGCYTALGGMNPICVGFGTLGGQLLLLCWTDHAGAEVGFGRRQVSTWCWMSLYIGTKLVKLRARARF